MALGGNFFVAAVRFAELLRRIPSIIFINLILYSESIITFVGITLHKFSGAKWSADVLTRVQARKHLNNTEGERHLRNPLAAVPPEQRRYFDL